MPDRSQRGRDADRRGRAAEDAAAAALARDGWTLLGGRLRTKAGEIDLAAQKDGLLALVEVKARPRLSEAAWSVTARQRRRLIAAAEILLAEHPDWGPAGVRFDLLLVDAAGRVRRITDAFRADATS
jgi:putative endonuclease